MRRTALGRLEGAWDRDTGVARLLAPLGWIFGAGVWARNALYDIGALREISLGLPAVSVGNLSVGGTGKTPVSAWVARTFAHAGSRPAILLRGYGGGDETLVHARLTPEALVVSDPDRVAGAARARAAGADVLVLDDAFQHRRARRDLDIVLIAAEQGNARRLLPAGPLREAPRALERAHVLLITRKSASRDVAEGVATRWERWTRGATVGVVALVPSALMRVSAPGTRAPESAPLDGLKGREVLALSALGSTTAFESQLSLLGAQVHSMAFPDHHAFEDAELAQVARRAEGLAYVVCTLKDAVKLEGRWPRQAPPLWYLSQVVDVERGEAELRARLNRLSAVSPS